MADMLFTLGADDREVQRALDRIDRSTDRTARRTEQLLSFQVLKHAFKHGMAYASEAIEAYGNSSEAARAKVDALGASHRKFMENLGRDLTMALGGAGGGWDVLDKWRTEAVNAIHDAAVDIAKAMAEVTGEKLQFEYAGEKDAAGVLDEGNSRAVQNAREYREALRAARRERDLASAELDGDGRRGKEISEEGRHEANMRGINALKVDSGSRDTLRQVEDERHAAAMDHIAREAAAEADKERIAEARAQREHDLREQSYAFMLEQLDIENRMEGAGKRKAVMDQIDLEYRRRIADVWKDEVLSAEEKQKIVDELLAAESGEQFRAGRRLNLEEARDRRFQSLELSGVADARTRTQVLGGQNYQRDPTLVTAEQTAKYAKVAADEATAQTKLLKSIDEGIGGIGGAAFQ